MIVEPVMGAGGAIVPPDGYFDAITKVLTRHAIPLISDEVITGFGRTGEWFGCAKYGFEPDSMSVAKALSSSYLPISAVLLSPELTELIDRESNRIGVLGHGLTYGGHPVTGGGGAQDHRNLSAPRHRGTCAPCFAALPRAAEAAGRPSAGGRGQGRGPDRGHRTGRGQENQDAFRSRPARSPKPPCGWRSARA